MPGYATVGSNRLNEALPFYDALLAVVGVTTLFEHSSGGRVYGTPGGTMFGVSVRATFLSRAATASSGVWAALRAVRAFPSTA